ncbi:MAG: glycosyltransferase family 4 protein, partial [Chloroflexi bacterium]
SDGLPISVLEAMACGAPVISTDLPGPREALGPHAESLVVPVGDPAALRDAIDRLLGLATSERRALAEALRQRAVEEFDFRTWMERMEGLYFAVRAAA